MAGSAGVPLPRRIVKETQRLLSEPVPGISAAVDESNARYFHIRVQGPSDSPYENGDFEMELFLPEEYPMSAPKIRTVLLSIQALLSAPNPDDPLANDVADNWKKDEEAAVETARQWTRMYAVKK